MDVDTGESLFVPIKVVLADRTDGGNGHGGKERSAEDGGDARTNASCAVAEDSEMKGDRLPAEDVSGGGGDGNGFDGGARMAAAEGDRGAAGTLSLVTPCILPDLKDVSRLSVCSPRYFPVELDIAGNPAVASALQRRCRIYVKRRVGHLSFKNVSCIKNGVLVSCLSVSFSVSLPVSLPEALLSFYERTS